MPDCKAQAAAKTITTAVPSPVPADLQQHNSSWFKSETAGGASSLSDSVQSCTWAADSGGLVEVGVHNEHYSLITPYLLLNWMFINYKTCERSANAQHRLRPMDVSLFCPWPSCTRMFTLYTYRLCLFYVVFVCAMPEVIL